MKELAVKTGPVLWGGPNRRTMFLKNEIIFAENFNKHGTIVGDLHSTPCIQDAVPVEFQSGEDLPGNDPVQMVPLSQLRPAVYHQGELIPDRVFKLVLENREEIEAWLKKNQL